MKINKSRLLILFLVIVIVGLLITNRQLPIGFSKDKSSEKYILFAGGTPDFHFSATVAKGAEKAAEDLGVGLEIYWSNWDTDKMVIQFKTAIDLRPDGIAVMGHPGEKALGFLINEAMRKNIVVTSLNTPLPKNEALYQKQGFGYVGQDVYLSGLNLARASYERFNLKPRDKVLFLGSEGIPVRGQRSASARKFFEDNGIEVIYIKHVLLTDYQERFQWEVQTVIENLKKYPDIALIFDDIDVLAASTALRKGGYPPEKYPLVGFDLSPGQLDDLDEGFIDLLFDQQPFLQGYLSVLQMTLSYRWRFSGLNINTGSNIVSVNTVNNIKKFVEQGIR